MKFFVTNYSCLQNPWQGGYRPQVPLLSVLCLQLNLLKPSPPAEQNSLVRHCNRGGSNYGVLYARLNPPIPHQRYKYPVSIDRKFQLSANFLCCQGEVLQQLWLLYVGIMCVLFSKFYTQVNTCADLDCVDNCDTGGVSNIFFIYLCEYINWAVLLVHKETGLWRTFAKLQILWEFLHKLNISSNILYFSKLQ